MAKTLAEPVDFVTLQKSMEGIMELLTRITTGELLSKRGAKKELQVYRKMLQAHSRLIKGAKLHAVQVEKALIPRKVAVSEHTEASVVEQAVAGETKVEVPE